MSSDGPGWTASPEIDAEFAVAAFHAGYNARRAEDIARHDHALLAAFYARLNRRFSGRSRILELGCELTRGSDWLSQAGPLVIADLVIDELRFAAERLNSIARKNINLALLRHIADIEALPPCDLFYSALSIKRTPPTVLAQVLPMMLTKVMAGGVALLHVPTQHRLYQLMAEGAQELHDLHVIPQWKLFELLERTGFRLILVQENPCFHSADVIYHTILAQRPTS